MTRRRSNPDDTGLLRVSPNGSRRRGELPHEYDDAVGQPRHVNSALSLAGQTHASTARRTAAPALNQRILALDLLRGYLLFMMIVDHVGRFSTLFDYLTGRGLMWVSATEGFFFISGIVMALARNREASIRGVRAAAVNMWKKAGSLYLWSVALTLFFTYVTFAVGESHSGIRDHVIDRRPFAAILYQTATLQYSFGWTNFLGHYAIFLLGAPLVLWLLRRNLWWVAAAASAGIWLSSARFECRWQVLFYAGMVCGFYLPAAEERFRRLDRVARSLFVAMAMGLAGVTMLVSASFVYIQPRAVAMGWRTAATLVHWNARLAPYFDKGLLPLPRLLMFGLWFGTAYYVFRRYEVVISRYLGWFLLPLGLYSLRTYIVHALVLLVVALIFPPVTPRALNFAIAASVLLLVWGVIVTTQAREKLRASV
jgi:hypothetical protein